MRRASRAAVVLLASSLSAGCAPLAYYAQSIGGQLDIWGRERAIEDVLRDDATPEKLKERLALVARLRDFATRELSLPDNASYRRYADLERPYVVWNVFAAGEFSLEPLQWCFPFAGCVRYRGYFSREAAESFAAGLAAEGNDVYIGSIPAYSTLGWFADPVLSTFVGYPDAELARLMFHELAHQVVYVPDDTAFNESFAVAVEQAGVTRWLARHGSPESVAAFEASNRRRAEFRALLLAARTRLAKLYAARIAPDAMRREKAGIIDGLEREYAVLKRSWGGFAGYDRWFAQRPNNAQLASAALYDDLVPGFQAMLASVDGDLPRFYDRVREIAALPRDERRARLGG